MMDVRGDYVTAAELLEEDRHRAQEAARRAADDRQHDDRTTIPTVEMLDAASFAGRSVPPRLWHVDELMPAQTVTGLSGDGATGKSTIALQLAVATVAGGYWLGRSAERGPCIYLTAEDDVDEVHRRLDAITLGMGIDLAALGGLKIIPLAHRDALLAAPDGRNGILRPTPLFAAVEQRIEEVQPALVVLDTKADLFGGDENNRAHARQFIGLLRAQAIQHRTTTLLLDHPSLGGLASGSGTSGSTAWNNSLRSRLYFERVKDESGKELDVDARVLRIMKSNYARSRDEIKVRWQDGSFKVATSTNPLNHYAAHENAERVFLELLSAYDAEGRNVTTAGPTYAPAIFAKDARADGLNRRALSDAMNRLFQAKRIRVEEVGPPSRRRTRIVPVGSEPAP
ncbi:AAA family ATPase [Ancylobacter sp. A5.8]|uniref:AAA family ATPase n=1 Tax=Ancylobacter gelatini TaxID=2919920 RepID=UPI001F4D9FB7|nr:AAA family ATPase [Ancylobacter gelatini]MCJ8141644.1 AAA family ATPase [Ancylobacter gelatini]